MRGQNSGAHIVGIVLRRQPHSRHRFIVWHFKLAALDLLGRDRLQVPHLIDDWLADLQLLEIASLR